jgi:hypothetical protein
MESHKSNQITLIKYQEEDKATSELELENSEFLRKLDEIASEKILTDSQAIYRISPVVIADKSHGNFVYPKLRVQDLDEALAYSKEIDISTDYNSVKQKFDLKEAMNAATGEAASQLELESESNFLDVVDPNLDINDSEIISIKKPENEEDPRKHLDKFNLFKGFSYAYDPLNTKSRMNYDDDYENCEVEFFSADTQIKDLLDINL